MERIRQLDILRGIVMCIMALDHTRDLIHVDALSIDPTNLTATYPSLFCTRWVTHICAPVFVFLAGLSAAIYKTRHADASSYLFTRGLVLILLESTLINFGMWADIHFGVMIFGVISAIGFGMIILSLLYNINKKYLFILGCSILILQHIIPSLGLDQKNIFVSVAGLFFMPSAFPIDSSHMYVMGYPPIPWLAIMFIGFSSSNILLHQKGNLKNKTILRWAGLFILTFFVLRLINIYGDPQPWATQNNILFTIFSFFNLNKYPPSLMYALLMLGIMALIYLLIGERDNKITRFFNLYGRVPLFYYIVHWYVIHFIMFVILYWQGFTSKDFVFGFNFGRPQATNGLSLIGVYGVWLLVIMIMYPLCRWYGQYKKDNPQQNWLKYI